MAQRVAIPVKGKPGTMFIPAIGKEVTQIDSREDDIYDSVGLPSGSTATGTERKWFDSLSDKNKQHTNLSKSHRILGGHELSLTRIGVAVRSLTGNAAVIGINDVKRILENGACDFQIGKRDIGEGPAIKFQSGYGLAGGTVETANNVVSNGVPSAAAAPTLAVPQDVSEDDDIYGRIVFPDASWLTTALWGTAYATFTLDVRLVVTNYWHGIVRKPLGK